ncbi:proline dehydrogenase [Massilia sp. CCM 8733]|uniref:Proline dehydrogenase n=1 Tax=Massilia mucilaginosa TaxID=2609282 RepID=A0ABX0NRU1_9BURK|nr:proline dehydrogenase family protein [Massilia mucilaginosa]NHZ89604.1 proline dehydrogenase [Massilia mucilaginosa]
MNTNSNPQFSPAWQGRVNDAAEALRRLALDEGAKERFCHDPALQPFLAKMSGRYVAGNSIEQAVDAVRAIGARGHAVSVEYVGESCRDRARADAETTVFLRVVAALDAAKLASTISLDLSHIGSTVDPELGFVNARRIAAAAARAGREVMISMEGSERADLIYAIYGRLHDEDGAAHVGITVPAKLHRSKLDFPKLMQYPGRIRLVKGAFAESADIALTRHDPLLEIRYRAFADELIASGRPCSIATHDGAIQQYVAERISPQAAHRQGVEFESLMGLGTEQIDELCRCGYPTREYAVFGTEYFLYVLNRIAEEPLRVYQAVIDLLAPGLPGSGQAWRPPAV